MKIISAVVDKPPSECASCPICVKIRSMTQCGKEKSVKKGHAVQTIKNPDHRCLLKIIGRNENDNKR